MPSRTSAPRTCGDDSLLEPHERAGVDWLSIRGFDVGTILEHPGAPANLDVLIDGVPREMKNLTNAASSVGNQLKRARAKWIKLGNGAPAMRMFTNEGNRDGFGKTCAALEAKRRPREVFMVFFGQRRPNRTQRPTKAQPCPDAMVGACCAFIGEFAEMSITRTALAQRLSAPVSKTGWSPPLSAVTLRHSSMAAILWLAG